jgi:hypothetical protein
MFNGHYYYYVSAYSSYQTAVAAAASSSFNGLQGHVVTITSQDEFDFLKNTFGNYSFWIAAGDAQSEAFWSWTAGPEAGLTIAPTFWQPGQPNGGTTANCGVMSSAGWDDQSCSTFLASHVVEYECQSATTSSCSRKGFVCPLSSQFH